MPGSHGDVRQLKPGPIIAADGWSYARRCKVAAKWKRKGISVRFRDHLGRVDYA
jgi:hypothetical protein